MFYFYSIVLFFKHSKHRVYHTNNSLHIRYVYVITKSLGIWIFESWMYYFPVTMDWPSSSPRLLKAHPARPWTRWGTCPRCWRSSRGRSRCPNPSRTAALVWSRRCQAQTGLGTAGCSGRSLQRPLLHWSPSGWGLYIYRYISEPTMYRNHVVQFRIWKWLKVQYVELSGIRRNRLIYIYNIIFYKCYYINNLFYKWNKIFVFQFVDNDDDMNCCICVTLKQGFYIHNGSVHCHGARHVSSEKNVCF